MPSLNALIQGRSDFPGALSQLGLGRDGTYYVIAAGRCNHAGAGRWRGMTDGNANFIGIEGENTGLESDFPWPEVQLDAYRRGVAAILKHVGRSADFCAGHLEYALPEGRKPDPRFDMHAFRSSVAAIMDGIAATPALIPAAEPAPPSVAPHCVAAQLMIWSRRFRRSQNCCRWQVWAENGSRSARVPTRSASCAGRDCRTAHVGCAG